MRLAYPLNILLSASAVLTLPAANKRGLLDALQPFVDPIKQAFEDLSKQVSETAKCVGKTEFGNCMEAFTQCVDKGLAPNGCDQGKVCLDKAGVDLKDCFS